MPFLCRHPPFSCAGKKKSCPKCSARSLLPHPFRTGIFACCECGHEWSADHRHLWPEFYRLIRECKPPIIFGEQVAGPDGEIWLAGVRACLEIERYGVGSSDLCSAGVSAPNIRQRLYWVAFASSEQDNATTKIGLHADTGGRGRESDSIGLPDATGGGRRERGNAAFPRSGGHADGGGSSNPVGVFGSVRLADAEDSNGGRELEEGRQGSGRAGSSGSGETDVRMGSPIRTGLEGHVGDGHNGNESRRDSEEQERPTSAPGSASDIGLGQSDNDRCGTRRESATTDGHRNTAEPTGGDGFWDDWRIVHFTDGKTRRLKPGIEPLAPRLPGDLDLLRAYGNAINPYVASEFIQAFFDLQKKFAAGLRNKTVND